MKDSIATQAKFRGRWPRWAYPRPSNCRPSARRIHEDKEHHGPLQVFTHVERSVSLPTSPSSSSPLQSLSPRIRTGASSDVSRLCYVLNGIPSLGLPVRILSLESHPAGVRRSCGQAQPSTNGKLCLRCLSAHSPEERKLEPQSLRMQDAPRVKSRSRQ